MVEKTDDQQNIKIGSERSFGLTFGFIFVALGLYFFSRENLISLLFFGISSCFLVLSWLAPHSLKFLNFYWFKFGLLIASIINPIILAGVFLLTIIPIGIVLKVLKKDPLKKRKDLSLESYWITSEKTDRTISSMRDQF